jgi:hypothetical protein
VAGSIHATGFSAQRAETKPLRLNSYGGELVAKDERLYARFDIAMDEHPKIALLSDASFRALFEATMYSRRQLTDGFLDGRVAVRRWGQVVLDELCTNDPEKPSLFPTSKRGVAGFQIHDYEKHQTTTADIEAKREAGRKGGLAKASNRVAPASDSLEQSATGPLAITETETKTKTPSSTKKVSASRRKPEIPMPDDWTPNETHVRIARECGVDGRREEAQFRDHAEANDRRQRDWDAAFRTWLRNARPQKATPMEKARRTVMLATELLEVES